MRPTYFAYFLFQINSEYPPAITTAGALAAFTQNVDAALLTKKLRKQFKGLDFPLYELHQFDNEGNLLEGAEEYQID